MAQINKHQTIESSHNSSHDLLSSSQSTSDSNSSSSSSQEETATTMAATLAEDVVKLSQMHVTDSRSVDNQDNSKSTVQESESCDDTSSNPTTTKATSSASYSNRHLESCATGGGNMAGDSMPLSKIVCVEEFQEVAKRKLDKKIYDYFCHGADDELTLNWNRRMISEKYCLRPRVMCDVSKVDLTKYIYGDKLSMPIGLSPTSMHKMAHPEGEKATVRACDRANALMILSLFSTTSLEEVAKAAPICVKWQNLYILKNRAITQNLINRAIRYGYRAIVVTCDAPVLGNRRHDHRNNFTLGEHTLENIEDSQVKSMREHSSEVFDPSVDWEDLADLKKSVGDTIRVIAKGIMTPEDAEQALQAGVDGIFVSNHGGRQLDGAQSTIEALPAIVRAVNKRCPVFVDSGFRTGADILKALALGADMVFVGRTPLWALASYGQEGVYAALNILREELKRAMMLCGCTKLSDINRNLVLERT